MTDRRRAGLVIEGCHIILIRSCTELESEWLRVVEDVNKKPVLPVGMLPPSTHEIEENTGSELGNALEKWLDAAAPGSTVYIAFGSEVRPSREQLQELAYGVELSGLRFLLALRSPSDEPAFLPEGLEDRTKDRGIVHGGWVPQKRILSHPSIGAFLSHGGLSSITETLALGMPLVIFAVAADQPLNARMIQEKKVGIEVPRNQVDGSFSRDDVAKVLRLAMLEAEGEEYRANAKAMMKIFGDPSIHSRYMDDVVSYLKNHKRRFAIGPPTPALLSSSSSSS
ncbi:hypothetical protein ACLOJK_032917 [Asimina triloba]